MRCKWTIFTIIIFRLGVQEGQCVLRKVNLLVKSWNVVHSQWSWDKIPKWTDVYLRKDGFYNLEFKLEFLMDNYDVISLEKCLYEDHNDKNTEAHFIDLTSKMRSLRPSSDTKILFYWHLTQIINDCYQHRSSWTDQICGCMIHQGKLFLTRDIMFWILESLKLEPCGLMVLENCLTSQIIENINRNEE